MNEPYGSIEVVNAPESYSWLEAWWIAVSRPTVAAYEALVRDPRASAGRAFGWMALATLFNLLLSVVLSLAGHNPLGALYGQSLDQDAMWFYDSLTSSLAGLACCMPGYVIMSLVLFAAYGGVTYLFARLLGGTGSYGGQLYLTAASAVPVSLATGLVSWIPCIGALVALPLTIYGVVLSVIGLKANHRFDWWKAIVSWLGLVVIVMVLMIAVFALVVVIAMLSPEFGGLLEEFSRELDSLTLLR